MTDPIQEVPPPVLLRLAAVFAIFYGGDAIVQTVTTLIKGRLWIDIGFVGIPIGGGLLAGRASSRAWAIGLSALCLAIMGAMIVRAMIANGWSIEPRDDFWHGALTWALTAVVFSFIFFGLRSSSVQAWFECDPSARQDDSAWKLPLVVLGLISATLAATNDFADAAELDRAHKTVRSGFAIKTKFEFLDAKTGERVKMVAYTSGITSSTSQPNPFEPRIFIQAGFEDEATNFQLSGFAFGPTPVTFTSDGYGPVSYTLTDQSPGIVVLEFQAK